MCLGQFLHKLLLSMMYVDLRRALFTCITIHLIIMDFLDRAVYVSVLLLYMYLLQHISVYVDKIGVC